MTHTGGGADGARAGRVSSLGAGQTPQGATPQGAGRSSPVPRAPVPPNDPLLRHPQYRGCFRKRPFRTRKEAREAAARVMVAEPGRKIRVYRCPYKKAVGEHWHLTSQGDR